MLLLLALHVVGGLIAPALVRWWGRAAFPVLGLVPATCAVWLVTAGPGGSGTSGPWALDETYSWIPSINLELAFRLDALSLVTGLLVTVVGALVLGYCGRYFRKDSPSLGRFAGVLMAFAGSMLGLVLADDMLLLYVFWELTTVFSYLLIGQHEAAKNSRRAALQALLVTTAGGLSMLVGLIVLGTQAGTYRISELVADPPSGLLVSVALVLVLVGALSKSALVPFHFWLPAAMAAPTPVSAYLHAAAMVKAGVYLVARLAPGFAEAPPWRPTVLVLGILTMLVGGWLALHQDDLKLLLAYGTVSQLGFLVVLVGAGTRTAALAGVAMLLAHGMFKATLFLVVGVIDRLAGTRDLRELSGLGRSRRVLAGVAVLAAVSMAGLPPFVGFVAKEAAFDGALAGGYGGTTATVLVTAGVVLGSVLTVAYSVRFVWGAFAVKPGVAPTGSDRADPAFLAAPALLAVAGLATGLLAPLGDGLLAGYADSLPDAHPAEPYHLELWHGLTPALGLSVVAVLAGVGCFAARRTLARGYGWLGGGTVADLTYRRLMRRVDHVAVEVTASTQRGSLSIYLGVILSVLVLLPGTALLRSGSWPASLRAWDTPVQAFVGAAMIVAAIAATRARLRLTAVLLVGVTGYSVGILFALHGAPDLALTQFLVETITLVVFTLVLRKLPAEIVERHTSRQKLFRLGLAVVSGMLVAGLAMVASGARVADAVSLDLPRLAYDFGGGRNVVNVALVDTRAWDTIGEISVLVVAATGVASLIFLRRRTGRAPRPQDEPDDTPPRSAFISAGRFQAPEQRNVLLEAITRVVFHTIVVLSVYLLFAGHNSPGGGFAGGLVAGLALVLRYLAGGRFELGAAAPLDAGLLLGLGLLFAGSTGVAGLLLGADVLQTAVLETTLPLLGDVKLVTSLFFDIGVYLVVVGLVLDVLRSLGAELDRQTELDGQPDPDGQPDLERQTEVDAQPELDRQQATP